mgnify:FL=1
MSNFLSFSCDYMEGAHPQILKRLMETNLVKTPGYGLDDYSKSAKEKIRDACKAPDAEVFFLVGGTQTNVTMIDAILKSYEGVIAADTGHVSVHEAGAIAIGGHKVLTLPHHNGKNNVRQIETLLDDYQNDANRDHMVMPGMVYLSHPTEYGTLYSKAELREISALCRLRNIPLYLDGARLAYALACPQNEITLADIAELCDAFYIGGTKCGALFGEAVVIPKAGWLPHLFTIIKQHGALLAKGRMLGIQFDELFTDYLYGRVGVPAIQAADRIRQMLIQKGYTLCFDSPTNQVFCIIENTEMEQLAEKVEFGFWEKYDDSHTIIRFATSWATKMEDVEALCTVL